VPSTPLEKHSALPWAYGWSSTQYARQGQALGNEGEGGFDGAGVFVADRRSVFIMRNSPYIIPQAFHSQPVEQGTATTQNHEMSGYQRKLPRDFGYNLIAKFAG
jgi:hypothetical protein